MMSCKKLQHNFQPIPFHLCYPQKTQKRESTHRLGLEKKRGKISIIFSLISSAWHLTHSPHPTLLSCRKRNSHPQNRKSSSLTPRFLNNIVFLLLKQFIIARWLVGTQIHLHTYTQARKWKFLMICVVFPYIQLSIPESRRKCVCFRCCFSSHPHKKLPHRTVVPSGPLYSECVCCLFTTTKQTASNGAKKKGRITYIKKATG